MGSAGRVDLSGLEPRYRVQQSRTALRVFVVVAVALTAVQVVRVVREPTWSSVAVSTGYVLAYGLGFVVWFWRPPTVFLDQDGLRVRRLLRTPPPVPWDDVLEVQVQTRWQDHSTAVVRGDRRIALPGVPAADAQRLADALGAARGEPGA
ncbi:PH domain-containing protein [Kineococcus sp. SYSU DK002]|uniref:PH domain-containing protein n=1 Tax=Kineococcus sp. SYSU DK002 TaxID=3383123 RepID=UPI003D7E568D